MGITCPACNKPNQAQALCARCGCELTLLHQVVGATTAALEQAQRCFRATDWAGALAQAERAWNLCHSMTSARMAFLAASALGQTQAALRWQARARR